MAVQIEDQVAENYRRLKEERGCSWAQLAKEMQTSDPRLARWMREQSPAANRKQAPRGRNSRGAKQQTAAE